MSSRCYRLCALLLLLACAGSTDSSSATGIVIVSGNNQSGVPGDTLARPLVVLLLSRAGEPLVGVPVWWTIVSGEGSIAGEMTAPDAWLTTTDPHGRTSAWWIVGPTGVSQSIVVGVPPDIFPDIRDVTFTATITGAATELRPVLGEGQRGRPGKTLPDSVVVRAVRPDGVGLPGVRVSWSVTAGDGSLGLIASGSFITGANGDAAVWWKLGITSADQRLTAAADLAGSPIAFTATAVGGRQWSTVTATPGAGALRAISGSSAANVFAVGDSGLILHHDGTAWRAQPSGTLLALRGLWVGSVTHAVAVGDSGTILRYDGHRWIAESGGTAKSLAAVWGTGLNDIHVVGSGVALHHDGTQWSGQDVGLDLKDVWGSSATDIHAVGADSSLARYDGTSWSLACCGIYVDLFGVWGTGPQNVFAVGSRYRLTRPPSTVGYMLRFDGSRWMGPVLDSAVTLNGIWGGSDTEIFAVGWRGLRLYYDGASWGPELTVTDQDLYDVWGLPGGDFYAVGAKRTIVRGVPPGVP